jgi:spectrin beta
MSGVEEAANPSTPAGSFESNVIRNLQRSLAEVQKRTFTKWVNSHLGKVGSKIDDLHADFRDGKKLITLLVSFPRL